MNKSFENLVRPATSLALVVGLGSASLIETNPAGASSARHRIASECAGLVFSLPKGGPGMSIVDVFPVMKSNTKAPEQFSGVVTRGNDKGELVLTPAGAEDPAEGEFTFTYNPNSVKTQEVTVSASVAVAGNARLQVCPDTTLHFNPQTFAYGPKATK